MGWPPPAARRTSYIDAYADADREIAAYRERMLAREKRGYAAEQRRKRRESAPVGADLIRSAVEEVRARYGGPSTLKENR